MMLTDFIAGLTTRASSFCPAMVFHGSSYPLLFFSLFMKKNKQSYGHCIEHIDPQSVRLEELKTRFAMSFLGNRMLYWLGDLSQLDEKKRLALMNFLHEYQGPHSIWSYCDDQDLKKGFDSNRAVSLGPSIDEAGFCALLHFFYPELAQKNKMFIKKVWGKVRSMTLDSACLMLSYCRIIGNSPDQFIHESLDIIIKPEQSLFTLSTHFFAKKATPFYQQWALLADQYSAPFWTTYWSEQLFRAYYYVYFVDQGSIVEAKKIAYRLPFSFMQHDWHKVSLDQLCKAHDFMLAIDTNIKHGGSESIGFEVFYMKFFNNEF